MDEATVYPVIYDTYDSSLYEYAYRGGQWFLVPKAEVKCDE